MLHIDGAGRVIVDVKIHNGAALKAVTQLMAL
jgi:hypothetical protein